MLKILITLAAMTQRKDEDERGASAVEYGLLVALIGLAIVLAVTAFGTNLGAFFDAIAAEVAGWTADDPA